MEGHDYDNRAAVPGWEGYFTRWRRRSKAVRAKAGAVLDLSYGPHPRERIDWFPANSPMMTLIFIHGGYWQWGSKEEFTFIAEPWLDTGADVAMLGYPLAPEFSVPEISAAVQRGVAYIADKSPGRVAIMGWSAGAQLAAQAGAKADRIVCLSGIYDLHPLLVTPVNDELGMTPAVATECSPLLNPPATDCLVAVGGDERVAMRQQAETYFKAVTAKGSRAVFHEWPGLNHYSIMDECASPNSRVFSDIKKFVLT